MMIAGMFIWIISQAKIRAKISAVLLVRLLVPYATGRGWTRERSGIIGSSFHIKEGCEFLITVTITLAVALATVGCSGWWGR